MKITIPKNELHNAMNKIKGVAASRTALPVLTNVLLEAEGTRLRLTASDLNISIECTIDCTVIEAGATTAPCQRLSMLLGDLPDADVTLTLHDNGILDVECGLINTKFYTISADEFPPSHDFSSIKPFYLKQAVLKKLFHQTAYAVCNDQSRHNITGLLMETKQDGMHVVATDGKRLSMSVSEDAIPTEEEAEEGSAKAAKFIKDIKTIIPSKTIHELQSLMTDNIDKSVAVYLGDNKAAFIFENLQVTTALIEGNFPNYTAVIPKKIGKEFILDLDTFRQCMRRCASMTSDKFRTVKFIFHDDNMQIIVKTPEIGEYEENIPVGYQGEKLEISFNPNFILDVLRNINSEQVCLQFNDGNSPGIIKPYTEAPVDSYINVIMPIRA
ncbi:MAG TPA: DNA polymerase III subunit beta [Candidatus Hydrogenedentes bacterium]|jgi:DNA polymerase-3 subunit beta|nr:MAG: DNA polymerase III subunit beta [Candidatus Hydrogenedentes bacterium ADurb.Bin170]HOM47632.1 DNA polymerase III subunit beta [Candidatus Hydrogenedentota bacterium]